MVWTVPAARTKGGREHSVPLSRPALGILEKLTVAKTGDFLFSSGSTGHFPVWCSKWSCPKNVTVHGFRSTFRDWCGDHTHFPREVAEATLAHVSGDATERAYRRGDALAMRRELMEAGAAFCEGRCGVRVLTTRRVPMSKAAREAGKLANALATAWIIRPLSYLGVPVRTQISRIGNTSSRDWRVRLKTRFASAILPRWARRTSVHELLPVLRLWDLGW
jgi:hypothetical protein